MTSPGATELLIVLVIVILILGPKRLPSLGRQLGGGIREFRRSLGGGTDETPASPPPASPSAATGDPSETAAARVDAERRSV